MLEGHPQLRIPLRKSVESDPARARSLPREVLELLRVAAGVGGAPAGAQ